MIKKSIIVRQISRFAFARYFSELIYLVRGFVLAAVFGPELFGVWASMRMVLKLGTNLDFGVFNALKREIPYEKGKGNTEKIDALESAALGFCILIVISIAVLALVYVLSGSNLADEILWMWVGLIVIYLVNQVFNYLVTRFFAHKKFSTINKAVLGVAVSSTLLGTVLAYLYGLGGFLFALGITYLMAAVFMIAYVSPLPRVRFSAALNREMVVVGLPISLSGLLAILLYNVDKLLIWKYMSHADLGIYAVQFYFTSFLLLLPKVVSVVLYPHVLEFIGREMNTEAIKQYLRKPVWVMSYLLCPIIGILVLSIHIPFQWVLQQYSDAIIPGQILLCASFFLIVAYTPRIILISLRRQNLVLAITALSVLCAIALNIYAIKSGHGINGVAIGTSISFAIYSTSIFLFSMRAANFTARESLHFIVLTCLPYLAVLVLIFVLSGMYQGLEETWFADVVVTTIKVVILLFLMFSVFYLVNKNFKLMEIRTANN